MKQSHIERPELKAIPGTDLAYILAPCAVNQKNGFAKYDDYLTHKLNSKDSNTPTNSDRVLREYCYKIYKREGRSLEELATAIKNNKAVMVGDTLFAVTNQDFTVDDNGNLILKSYGSDLEDYTVQTDMEGGDILINIDGDVLRNTHGHMFIHKADSFGNYPVDVFVTKRKPMSDEVDIIRIDYNFLNPFGSVIRQKHFQSSNHPSLQEVNYTYSDHSQEDKPFIDRGVYPKGYMLDFGATTEQQPMFFPSATALLIRNREFMEESQTPIIDNETPYLVEHFKRMQELPDVERKLTNKWNKGTISYMQYKRAMGVIQSEKLLADVFSELSLPSDRLIEEEVLYGNLPTAEMND